jgi:transposase-like protein
MKCPKCGSEKVIKFGNVPSVTRGELKRYRCPRGHTFYSPKDYQKKK